MVAGEVTATGAGVGATVTATATATDAAAPGTEVGGVTRAGACGLAVAVLLAVAVGVAGRPGPEIQIRVSSRGFEPREVTVRKGEATRVVLSAEAGEHCFAVDALRVEKRVVAGRPTTFDLIADRRGRFPFYCCVETGEAAKIERGEIVVTD
jgi:hypothetical protein